MGGGKTGEAGDKNGGCREREQGRWGGRVGGKRKGFRGGGDGEIKSSLDVGERIGLEKNEGLGGKGENN